MPKAEARYTITAEDKTGRAFDSVKARFKTAAGVATRAAGGIAAAAGAGFAIMAKQAIDAADETAKLSRQLGVSTENLSEMRGVLELTGGSFEGYTTALAKMQRNITTAADGSKSMNEALGSIGVTVEELQALTPEQQFERISAGLAEMTDATQRSARAQQIFGRNAETVLRLVDAGADAVAEMREEQREMGNSLGMEAAQGAERFNDAMARLSQTLQGAVLQVVGEHVDSLASGMETLSVAARTAFDWVVKVFRVGAAFARAAGGIAAAVGAAATGNFSGAGAIAGEAVGDFMGTMRDVFDANNAKTDETNRLLRDVASNTAVARAG